jgi:hypothetical protein
LARLRQAAARRADYRAERKPGQQTPCSPGAVDPRSLAVQLGVGFPRIGELKQGDNSYEQAYGAHAFEVVQAGFRKRMLLELIGRLQPDSVLEVGCGLDSFANHWTASRRFDVVEPREGFAAEARRTLGNRAEVTLFEGVLEQVARELSADYDLILLSGLLNEIADCGPLLRAVRDLCGNRTVVHANVPNARSVHRLLAFEMGLIGAPTEMSDMQKVFQQPWIFTQEALADLVQANGFDVFEQGSYFIKPFTHGQMQRLQAEGFLTDEMLEGLWGLERHMPGLGSEIFVNMRRAG